MFDEPEETRSERPLDAAARAKEKIDECRTHAERAAVFEGPRKFDARILPGLNADIARDVQRGVGRLEKAKSPESPVLPPEVAEAAAELLKIPQTRDLPTGDYHVYRRPGEVMIVRWLAGDDVETFYERFQAHFDVALEQFREEDRAALEWKRDPRTLEYLKLLDAAVDLKMADVYLRQIIRQHKVFILSTQAADEMNIAYLCDDVMGVPPGEVVGEASAPPDDAPTERDLAWFFKLFSLRGVDADDTERMCFFTYLQKSDEDPW
jgi:hypothetical protein